jgi:hypothetical protein
MSRRVISTFSPPPPALIRLQMWDSWWTSTGISVLNWPAVILGPMNTRHCWPFRRLRHASLRFALQGRGAAAVVRQATLNMPEPKAVRLHVHSRQPHSLAPEPVRARRNTTRRHVTIPLLHPYAVTHHDHPGRSAASRGWAPHYQSPTAFQRCHAPDPTGRGAANHGWERYCQSPP